MKTAIGLHFSTVARAARVALLVAVVAMLAVVIAGMFARTDQAAPDTHRTEEPSHYNFPTYA
jgi:hypothetical protein